jgi:hypothetical protein
MANNIHPAGTTNILASSSTGPGSWFRLHPAVRAPTVQMTLTGSSVGVLISGVANIEVSNDGINPCQTLAGTITLSSLASPTADGFALVAHWEYMRANLQSISSGAASVVVSAGNQGV